MRTKSELITRALRRLRVVAMDEQASADQEAVVAETLQALEEELQRSFGIVIPLSSSDEIEDDVFLPLAYLLAAEIAPEFAVPSPERRSTALIRLRSVTNPNDKAAPTKAEYY